MSTCVQLNISRTHAQRSSTMPPGVLDDVQRPKFRFLCRDMSWDSPKQLSRNSVGYCTWGVELLKYVE